MSNDLKSCCQKQDKKEKGASLVEYALLVGLIAVICIAAVTIMGQRSSKQFSNIASAMPS